MKRIIVLFLILVTVFSNLSGCASKAQWTDKTSLSDEERVSKLLQYERAYTIPFEEVFETADLVVTVRIVEFKGYYIENGFTPSTVFQAEILAVHRDGIGYTDKTLYVLQYGTPERTISGYPLFKNGDVFLLGLTRSDEGRCSSKDYECTFDIMNSFYGIVQLFDYNGSTYAINRAIPNIFSLGITPVEKARFDELKTALFEYDPVLQHGIVLEAYLYEDVLSYMEVLKQ